MAGRFAQGIYTPKNPEKYIGKGNPKFRSSWELMFFNFCDGNTNVLKWASESIHIPYRNPITGKQTIYIPDVFILYRDKNGKENAELIEIKPSSQATLSEAKSKVDKVKVVVNQAKWQAAMHYCARLGMKFRVVTEAELFHGKKK